MHAYAERSLRSLAQELRAGGITASALFEACRARAEACDERFHTYIARDEERGRKAAELADLALALGRDLGPLMGIPLSVKDIYGLEGYRTHAGTPRALPEAWEAQGPLIEGVARGGAVFQGKTHTVEFAFGGLGVNTHHGTPRNPWDSKAHRVPGGSSAGAGISLVEGSALLAFGTDTAGSVRIPASMTGTVGFKPTYGYWPTQGIVPLSTSLDSPGFLVRSVADAAFAFPALEMALGHVTTAESPEALAIGGLRIGVPESFFWDEMSPGVGEAVETALSELERAGATLKPIRTPECAAASEIFAKGGLAAPELLATLRQDLPEWHETLDAGVKARVDMAGELSAAEYIVRCRSFQRLAAKAVAWFRDVDVVATPTVPVTPPGVEEVAEPEAYKRNNLLALRNTGVVNCLGMCALTMPVGLDAAGMPVGLHLIAPGHGMPGHGERRLLSAGLAAEGVLGQAAERLGRPDLP